MGKIMVANQIAGLFKMQDLSKEVNDEAYFWHGDEHWRFLQVDSTSLGVHNQTCPKHAKRIHIAGTHEPNSSQ